MIDSSAGGLNTSMSWWVDYLCVFYCEWINLYEISIDLAGDVVNLVGDVIVLVGDVVGLVGNVLIFLVGNVITLFEKIILGGDVLLILSYD